MGGRTLSTTEKVSSHQVNGSQIPEKKSLLAGDISIPTNETKCNCVDYLHGVI
jgi:hypothetical protein